LIFWQLWDVLQKFMGHFRYIIFDVSSEFN